MGYEDFTTFTEVDPLGWIEKTSTLVTVTEMHQGADAYLWKDYGAAHFTDFTHLLDIMAVYHVAVSANAQTWVLANIVEDWAGCGDALNIRFAWGVALDYWYIQLSSRQGATTLTDVTGAINEDTQYYLTLTKSGTDLTLYIYTDPARTNLFDTLNVTMDSDQSYQYLLVAQSNNAARTDKIVSFQVANLDIGEVSVETPTVTTQDATGIGKGVPP